MIRKYDHVISPCLVPHHALVELRVTGRVLINIHLLLINNIHMIRKYDHVISPCLVPHHALVELDPRNECTQNVLNELWPRRLLGETAMGAVGVSFALGGNLAEKKSRLTMQEAHRHVSSSSSPPIVMHTKVVLIIRIRIIICIIFKY
jgi:hypothetical protein